ncbi:MAG: hypothetical protein KDN22_02670 [Verrucomicrobiae bacterium]|nr:hypothetical protein [Verrucomicrobiae bacterium]
MSVINEIKRSLIAMLIFVGCVAESTADQLYSENFDSLAVSLQAFQSDTESGGDGTDWTAVPPIGITVNNDGVPSGGVPEFAGWTFLDPVSWDATAQQGRSQFTKAQNVVAVADGDEWDDSGPGARMETVMVLPDIALAGAPADSVVLKFDSSWNTEPQTGIVTVVFDGGAPTEILRYDSTVETRINESVVLPIENPTGAVTMSIAFAYEAGNNWWWAIDNIEVTANEVVIVTQPVGGETLTGSDVELSVSAHGGVLSYQWFKGAGAARTEIPGAVSPTLELEALEVTDEGYYSVRVTNSAGDAAFSDEAFLRVIEGGTTILFSENFDGLQFGPNVDEPLPAPNVWTDTPPVGWVTDDSGVPGFDSPDENNDGYPDLDGVTEWAGWAFADPGWWAQTAGDQGRTSFTRACGAVMIADPDEWDDSAHTPFTEGDGFDAYITTSDIPLGASEPGSVKLRFDSSWRPEADTDVPGGNNQTAVVSVAFDGGEPVEILRWESEGDLYKADATNELVELLVNNPAGASNMKVTFALINAGNDWWWAVDNLMVFKGVAPPAVLEQPQDLQVFSGSDAMLVVGADPDTIVGSAKYQWYKGQGTSKVMIDGATSATLTIPNAQVEDTGFYSAFVSNDAGGTFSCEAQLIVGPMILTEQPSSLLVSAGDEACFRVAASGQSPFTYKWFKGTGEDRKQVINGVNVFGADTFELVIESATFDDADVYSVEVSNAFGSVVSQEATLRVEPIILVEQPLPTTAMQGEMAEITILIDGEEPVDYTWYFRAFGETEAVEVEGDFGFRLTIENVQVEDAGFYSVLAKNIFGELLSPEVKLIVQPQPGGSVIFSENFDSLPLGPNVDEAFVGDAVWTNIPPQGWVVDNSGVPGNDSPDENGDGYPDLDGVTEWAGWAYVEPFWWSQAAGDQQRSSFELGQNVVAVADPDEWDDAAHSPFGQNDGYDTLMSTPAIAVSGIEAGSAVLKFDSSWRPEADNDVPGGNNQTAVVRVSYDGGEPFEVVRWESDPNSPNFKPDAEYLNESLTVALLNPDGAKNMVLTFGLLNAGNDWWWAIDNIEVTASLGGSGFEVTNVTRDPATGALTLSWVSTPGASYAVEMSTTLQGEWAEQADGVASEGLVTSYTVNGITGSEVFVRVRVEQ